MCWQGHLRWRAKRTPDLKGITVLCEPGHEILYRDFATQIIHQDHFPSPARDCWANRVTQELLPIGLDQSQFSKIWTPSRLKVDHSPSAIGYQYFRNQVFVPFGVEEKRDRLIVFHARKTNKNNTGYRDWDTRRWAQLYEWAFSNGFGTVSVGSKTESICVGSENSRSLDQRGLSLEGTVAWLRKAHCIVGPSSGPMVLALHSKCPTVTWGPNDLRVRYGETWNPLKTKAKFCSAPNWSPEVESIIELIESL